MTTQDENSHTWNHDTSHLSSMKRDVGEMRADLLICEETTGSSLSNATVQCPQAIFWPLFSSTTTKTEHCFRPRWTPQLSTCSSDGVFVVAVAVYRNPQEASGCLGRQRKFSTIVKCLFLCVGTGLSCACGCFFMMMMHHLLKVASNLNEAASLRLLPT